MLKKIKGAIQKPLVKQMAVYALTDGLSRAFPFLIMPIIALYLQPAEFGKASNFMTFTQIIGAFIGLGTQSYYSVDYYRTAPSNKPKFLSNLILINFAVTILSFIIISFSNEFIKSFFAIALQWQLLGALMMFFSAVTDMFVIYLRMEEKLKQYTRYQIFTSFLTAGLTLLFVVAFLMSWQGRIYALVLANLILFLIVTIYFAKKKLLVFEFEKSRIIDAVRFGVPLLPHKLSTWLRSAFDRIVITKKYGVEFTGLYSFGSNISNAVSLFVTSFFNAFTPYVYKQLKIGEDDISKTDIIKLKIVKTCYLTLVIYTIVLVFANIVLTLFVQYFFSIAYQGAIVYLPFFFIGMFFNFIYSLFALFIFYSKKTKYLGVFTIGVALLQTAMVIPLMNIFGTIGAAYALALGGFFKAFIIIIYSQRVFSMPWLLKSNK